MSKREAAPAAPAEFEVYYSLSSMMRVMAANADEASEQVFAALHDLIGGLEKGGLGSQEAKQVQLNEAEIEIDLVGTVSKRIETIHTIEEVEPQQEFFDIYASISREELELAGFDARLVTDEEMARLARRMTDDYMKQLYFTSLRIVAEALGIPKRLD